MGNAADITAAIKAWRFRRKSDSFCIIWPLKTLAIIRSYLKEIVYPCGFNEMPLIRNYVPYIRYPTWPDLIVLFKQLPAFLILPVEIATEINRQYCTVKLKQIDIGIILYIT